MLPNVTTDRCGTKPTVIVKKPKVTCLRTYHGELLGREMLYWPTKAKNHRNRP